MRVVDVRERSIGISRYRDPTLPSGGLTTSVVAVTTDVIKGGKPVVGYGFASFGRYAQGGLIRERFAPRLTRAGEICLKDGSNLDPFRAWRAMMVGEKPGGHGERCVAVGTLDMALWDAAAKIAGLPLYKYLAQLLSEPPRPPSVRVYAAGGYYYPQDDIRRLTDEVRLFLDRGFKNVKMKIGGASLAVDVGRIEAVLRVLHEPGRLAVDAMNVYDHAASLAMARALGQFGLWWFEDPVDPLEFATLAEVATNYAGPIAVGEALFSTPEARLLDAHGGLRKDRDILQFDPVHCYGLPGFLKIFGMLEGRGWPRSAFWPHGGHLFALHVVAALGLGGAEVNPLCFQPFGDLAQGAVLGDGCVAPPEVPGIGFELQPDAYRLFQSLH